MITRCIHCGSSLGRLISLALIADSGGSSSEHPIKCSSRDDGGDHEFDEGQPK